MDAKEPTLTNINPIIIISITSVKKSIIGNKANFEKIKFCDPPNVKELGNPVDTGIQTDT